MSFNIIETETVQLEPVVEGIHPEAALEKIAFNIIVRAIKDIHNPPADKDYNHDAEVERILRWTESDHFKAVCTVADLDYRFVSALIERVCGLPPDFPMPDISGLLPQRPRSYSGVDPDPEALIWGDE